MASIGSQFQRQTTQPRGRRTIIPGSHRYPPGVNWHQTFTPAPLHELLDRTAQGASAAYLHEFPRQDLTYGDIAAMVDRTAAGLAETRREQGHEGRPVSAE